MIFWLLLLLGLRADAKPRMHTVEIRGMEFHPAVITVAVGDTVRWINQDIVPHTATASGRITWDTGQLTQGQAGRFIGRARGTARYACTLHPTMHGRVIIR
ncbi:MAG TPA: plastocyanin/azurin family copper-binding protein [Gemmatimonadales bacterium]|nr:plastocyanin/azurin family copper-binding protein [Gemmatimonadales bacterium]